MRDDLCHLTRNYTACVEGVLAHKDLPVKEIAKTIIHLSDNFRECLARLLIEVECRETHSGDHPTQ